MLSRANALIKLRQCLVENLYKVPHLRVRVVQGHGRDSDDAWFPLVGYDAGLLEHVRDGIQSPVCKENAELCASRFGVGWGDDAEAVLVVRAGLEESLQIGSQFDGFLADVGHARLVEDGEGAA